MRWVSWLIFMMRTLTVWPMPRDFARSGTTRSPGDVGHMQKAVDAAEIDERAIVGEVLDRAVDDLAFGEVGDDLVALFGPALLEDGAARDDDVAAAPVHLQDLERLGDVHQRPDVAHRANVDLAARQERHDRPVEINGEAALDRVEKITSSTFSFFSNACSKLSPSPPRAAPRPRTRTRFAERILDPLEIHLPTSPPSSRWGPRGCDW